jgi:predicted PurR-regulated permease PerM
MSDSSANHTGIDLKWVAAATTVVLAIVAASVLLYYLIDILLLLFLGIVVSAALQPGHVRLCTWGVPRGVAVVLIFLIVIVGFVAVTMAVAPVVIDEVTKFTVYLPDTYTEVRRHMRNHETALMRVIGQRLPSYDALVTSLVALTPTYFANVMQVTAGVLTTLAYVVTVFVFGIYWTLELPRIERLIVSSLPVHRRARTLTMWHEIEVKLGGYMRGQFLAMGVVGAISGLGYLLIGLPNVLVLAVLAAALEAVPLIGPVLAAVPAVAVALPLGTPTVLAVIGLAVFVQVLENNLIMPRIMTGTVGTSALVALAAVLAFGVLYGVLGVLIAIPVTAVIQVIVDRVLINAEPRAVPASAATQLEDLSSRVWQIRQQLRTRLRGRDSRMGIDPDTADHVGDAVDQQIEKAVDHVEHVLQTTGEQLGRVPAEAHAAAIEDLEDATTQLEEAVSEMAKVAEVDGPKRPDADPHPQLRGAAQRAEGAVERAQATLAQAQDAAAEPSPNGGEPPVTHRRRRARKRVARD